MIVSISNARRLREEARSTRAELRARVKTLRQEMSNLRLLRRKPVSRNRTFPGILTSQSDNIGIMHLSKSETERLKVLLEQGKLRERSAALQAQSKDLQSLVRQQHYEMLLLQDSLDSLSLPDYKFKANR